METADGVRCGPCPRGFIGNGRTCRPGITCADRPCFPGICSSVFCQFFHKAIISFQIMDA
jgi:hypothetical protein